MVCLLHCEVSCANSAFLSFYCLQIPDSWLLPDGVHFVRKLPWTYAKSDFMKRNKQLTADEQLALQLLVSFHLSHASFMLSRCLTINRCTRNTIIGRRWD